MTPDPRVLRSEAVAEVGDRVRVRLDRHDVELPDERGHQEWFSVTAQDGIPGVVCLAVADGRVLVGKHWRLSTSTSGLELPRGFGEAGEKPELTALRELHEETGLAASHARVLGHFFPDSGLLTNRVVVVELGGFEEGGAADSDDRLTGLRWMEPAELDHLVRTGALTDGITLSALALWRACSTGRDPGNAEKP